MNRDNGFDRAQREYDNQTPVEHDDYCEQCGNEIDSCDLNEVKVNNRYKYICESCYDNLLEHGFLNKED